MTLKMHIGFFILLAMGFTLFWGINDELVRKYEWYIPTVSALLATLILEAFGWTFWYFFIV